MLKRCGILTVLIALVALPVMVWAEATSSIVAAKATVISADGVNTVTVPLEITNQDNLAAIDLALKFSPGVTLKKVDFENTRVSYFDLKVAKIDNAKSTVFMMLLPQITQKKPDLKAGSGPIANLVFEVADPTVKAIDLQTTTIENPRHSPLFIYHQLDENGKIVGPRKEVPKFENLSIAVVSTNPSGSLPKEFSLAQNYPNPFNPTTQISFDLPVSSNVELVVFNVLGQEVKTLVNEEMPAGTHLVTWDGRNASGSSVASGLYFYRISADKFSASKKMLLMK